MILYNIDDKIEEYQLKTDDEEVSVSGNDILDGRVTINDVVDGGEHPEDSQDQEQLCVEHLKRLFLLLNKERKLECVCC